ncbi:unnamed protein product, partial [Symbiodinium sp. KB8]
LRVAKRGSNRPPAVAVPFTKAALRGDVARVLSRQRVPGAFAGLLLPAANPAPRPVAKPQHAGGAAKGAASISGPALLGHRCCGDGHVDLRGVRLDYLCARRPARA